VNDEISWVARKAKDELALRERSKISRVAIYEFRDKLHSRIRKDLDEFYSLVVIVAVNRNAWKVTAKYTTAACGLRHRFHSPSELPATCRERRSSSLSFPFPSLHSGSTCRTLGNDFASLRTWSGSAGRQVCSSGANS